MGSVWLAKLGVVAIGLAGVAVGVGLMRFGEPVIVSLNQMYARLPGRFQYPRWWHRLVGGVIACIGLLIACVGAIFAH